MHFAQNLDVGEADLLWMIRKSFSRETAFKLRSRGGVRSDLMKGFGISTLSRVNSMCKGSEARISIGN